MSTSKNRATPGEQRTYSSFWAIGLVFLTLIFLNCCYLWNDYTERQNFLDARVKQAAALAKAQTISQTTEAVGREIVRLSIDGEEARKIMAEFNIQIDNTGTRNE